VIGLRALAVASFDSGATVTATTRIYMATLRPIFMRVEARRASACPRVGSWPEIIADLDSLTETEVE
jgi:hypothetical protein